MSDEDLQSLVRDGDYEKVVLAARRVGRTSVLNKQPLLLSSRNIFYTFILKYKQQYASERYFVTGDSIDDIIAKLAEMIDARKIAVTNLGYRQITGGSFAMEPSYPNGWRLTRVPTIIIAGQRVILRRTQATPHFKVKNIDIFTDVFAPAGEASNWLVTANGQSRAAQERKRQEQADANRNRELKALRRQRLTAFKEALKVSPEVAKHYADAIKDDPEFRNITRAMLNPKCSGVSTEGLI